MHLLLIDNYDSFTYNLHHYLLPLVDGVDVHRNDELDIDEVENYDAIVFSPGPGLPADAGVMPDIINRYVQHKPMLGVCLGHQAIAEHFGANLVNMNTVLHGQPSACHSERDPLFESCEQPMIVGHYHSWVVDSGTLPDELQVIASHEDGYVMAMRHRGLPIYGVQFHPESILTPDGKQMLRNWIGTLSMT